MTILNDFIIVMACFGLLIIFGCIWAVCLEILEDWRDQIDKKRNMPLLPEEERRQMRAGGVRRER